VTALPQRTTSSRAKFIFFEQFQIELPLTGNRIIVLATVADPVGGRREPTSELPP
jgi:hypothetical protein